MASSYYDEKNKVLLQGFCQKKGSVSIGHALNSGYTELLASKLYNDGNIINYKSEAKIASLMELFFDDPKEMTSLYLNFNLPGLIKHFEQYAPREEVVKLILDIDAIKDYYSYAFLSPIPSIKYIKTELTLYKWASKNKDKQAQFQEIISKNKFISLLLKNKKFKLYQSPYALKEQYEQEDNIRKI